LREAGVQKRLYPAAGEFSPATMSEAGRGGEFRILAPGRNCLPLANARRAAAIADAADYFHHLDSALRQAQRSIIIIGWDFDASIRLRIDGPEERFPSLADLLRSLVDERPDLEVRILIWNLSTLHAPGATMPMLFGAPWQDHPRIKVKLDNYHPVYGAQHQKIVAIDDSLAFVGGMDLTVRRWDTCSHDADDPRRIDEAGKPYEPVHDLQMVVEGEIARTVADIAYARWRVATGERHASNPTLRTLWPEGLPPDFIDTSVAASRTAPRWGKTRGYREIEALTYDALKAAERTIYIEAQYLADRRVGAILVKHLARHDGPEIVIVVTHTAHGNLEAWVMGGNRDRILRRLMKADRFRRFRACYPVITGSSGECEIFMHSKLLIVDDRFLRIGSSNLNRRSMGLDMECDLSIEATDAETEGRIARIRARLLGEHLDAAPQAVHTAFVEEGSLIRAIDRLNGKKRRLRRYEKLPKRWKTILAVGSSILDPRVPYPGLSLFRRKRSRRS
jgi:phosphatidylserine/phosphatidylglycerophosphate/cardiolipin synthase-like enzyme